MLEPAAVPIATRFPGVGPRAAATVIDAIVGFIVIGVPILLIFGNRSTVNTTGGTSTGYSTSDPLVLLLWCVVAIAYYIVFESLLGATPGKFCLGLRVRLAAGGACDLRAATIRNVARVIDAFPYVFPYVLGAIVIWADDSTVGEHHVPRRRRVGDRLAGTIVTYR